MSNLPPGSASDPHAPYNEPPEEYVVDIYYVRCPECGEEDEVQGTDVRWFEKSHIEDEECNLVSRNKGGEGIETEKIREETYDREGLKEVNNLKMEI